MTVTEVTFGVIAELSDGGWRITLARKWADGSLRGEMSGPYPGAILTWHFRPPDSLWADYKQPVASRLAAEAGAVLPALTGAGVPGAINRRALWSFIDAARAERKA